MSNIDNKTHGDCSIGEACNTIELVIEPKTKDLGGFSVKRLLPVAQKRSIGPWIFFDHMGPAVFAPGEGIDVRPHPHINLATVTYLFEGEILHRDSVGSLQSIKPGDINLMVAGTGIVHSERTPEHLKDTGQKVHALQLWLALPKKDEEVEPAFYHYPSTSIPTVVVDDVPIRVMIGSVYGVVSPVKTFARTFYAEAHLQAGQFITIPNDEERGLYIAQGSLTTGSLTLKEHSMAVFKKRTGIVLTALEESRVAIIGGETLSERYIDWNFVSSSKERIEQAKEDWKNHRFPKVIGDENEFIPLPE
jgi:redox-sensitive bicupin YhaK (pirin superfamily)